MAILLLTDDLMLSSQVSQTAKQAGQTIRVTASEKSLFEWCQSADVSQIILDMNHPQMHVGELVSTLRTGCAASAKIVAVAPHVHAAKLEAAQQAGCDQVLTRGQFQSKMSEVIAADSTS